MGYRKRRCAISLLLMSIIAAIIVYKNHIIFSDIGVFRPNHHKEVSTIGIVDEDWDNEDLDQKEDLSKDFDNTSKMVHKSTSSPSDATQGIYGYVLNLRYGGQQHGGAGSMASLQCWIKSFNLPMLIDEPAIRCSMFYAADKPTLRLGDIFDLQKFNNLQVGNKRYGKIATWVTFWRMPLVKSCTSEYLIQKMRSNIHDQVGKQM